MTTRLQIGRAILQGRPHGKMYRIVMTGGAKRFEGGIYRLWVVQYGLKPRGNTVMRSFPAQTLWHRVRTFTERHRRVDGQGLGPSQLKWARPADKRAIRAWMMQHPADAKFLKAVR